MAAEPASMKEWLAESGPVEELKSALRKALRDLDKAKRHKDELVEAVYQAARDGISALTLPPVPKPTADRRKGDAEVAVVLLSDWQLAKITPTYSTEVCERRIEKLADKVEKLAAIQRADHPVREVYCLLLGDLVEGELVFPGQAHLIDASLYRQVVVDGPRILGNFLRRMAATFDKVHVVSVIGNHGAIGGRARRDYHPESNADAMMYRVTQLALEDEKRVVWSPTMTPGERHWYATADIGSKRWFLFHGDQVKGGFGGIAWYGFQKKLLGWNNIYGFHYAVSGHFHTPVSAYYTGGLRHWGNGSTESDNTYAAEQLAASGEPSQWLLFQHPERGVTAEYLVRLEE